MTKNRSCFLVQMIILVVILQKCKISKSATLSVAVQLAIKLRFGCFSDVTKYRPELVNRTKCTVDYNLICWPETEAGANHTTLCPAMFYLPSRNVTRRCYANGTWEKMTLATVCDHLPRHIADQNFLRLLAMYNISLPTLKPVTKNPHLERQIKIFVIMQWISFGIMIPSLLLLLIFPNLNDDRMNLHRCLVLSFLMSVITFLPEYYLSLSIKNPTACNALWILNRLFAVCEVTWMFNEGLYLLKSIVFVFNQQSYIWLFVLFGWGCPILLTLCIWTPVMAAKIGQIKTRCWTLDAQNNLMLIIYVPMTIMLVVNLIILLYVIGVVITKIKQSHSGDILATRKAARGALVLMPLLGIIYLMIFYAPRGVVWYDYCLVIAQPMQGILVCVAHVILNKEIHSAIKNKWRKLNTSRTMFHSTKFFSAVGGSMGRTREQMTERRLTKKSSLLTRGSNKVAPNNTNEVGNNNKNNDVNQEGIAGNVYHEDGNNANDGDKVDTINQCYSDTK